MKLSQVLASLFFLTFLSCAALQNDSEYSLCHALEAKQAQVSYTMDKAQDFANEVTDGEHQPLIHAILFYPYLAESLKIPGAVSAYFDNTRTIFSADLTIEYRYLVHELAHAMCDAGPNCDGPPHGPRFVEMERRLFAKYPAR